MFILYTVETYVYLIVLSLISVKLLDSSLRKNAVFVSLLEMLPTLAIYKLVTLAPYKDLLMLAVSLIIPLICSKFLLEEVKTVQLIYVFFLMYVFNAIFSYCFLFFLPKNEIVKICIEFTPFVIMLTLSIIVSCTRISERIKLVLNWTSRKVKILLLATMVLCMLIICWVYLACEAPATLKSSKFIYFGCITLVWMIVLLSISYPILVLNSATNTYLKHLTRNYETQIANQAEHYTAIAKANFELRRFRHDFKNISLGVKALITDGKPDEAVEVLERIKNDIYGSTDFVLDFDTGNGIVDALLVDKQQKSAAANTVIKFEGSVPSNGIDATELCVIFGNTLDNAIEACQKINSKETKTIDVRCESGNGFMFIRISNPTNRDVTIINNTVETTKDNKQLHGFGIYSLNQTVKKHDGDLKLVCKNKKFIVDISMSLACV